MSRVTLTRVIDVRTPDVPLPDDRRAACAGLFRAFGWYLRWFFWRNFHAVRVGGPVFPLSRRIGR